MEQLPVGTHPPGHYIGTYRHRIAHKYTPKIHSISPPLSDFYNVHNSALVCLRSLTVYRMSHICRSIKIDIAVAVFDTVAIPIYTKRFFHLIICIKLMLHTQEERVNIDAPEIISIVFIHALQRTAVEHSNPFHAQLLQAPPYHPQLPLPRHISLNFNNTKAFEIFIGRIIEFWRTCGVINIAFRYYYYHSLSSTS